MEEIPHLFVLLRTDGLRLQVGNIVKGRTFCPSHDCRIVGEMQCNVILAKFPPFDIICTAIVNDFEVQCDVKYISLWDGGKLKSKTVVDKVYIIASTKFFHF